MKKIYILLISLFVWTLFGCEDHEAGVYKGNTFVQFVQQTNTFPVLANGEQILEVEIGASQKSKIDRTYKVSVDADKTTAVAGRDYQLLDQQATISAGESTGYIRVKGMYENLTTEGVILTIKLSDISAEQVLPISGISTEIHLFQKYELTMDKLVGNYIESDYDLDGVLEAQYPVKIQQKQGSADEVIISNFWGAGLDIIAKVYFDKNELAIEPQLVQSDSDIGDLYMINIMIKDGKLYANMDPIPANCTHNGDIIFGSWGANLLNTSSLYGVYTRSVLSKQE